MHGLGLCFLSSDVSGFGVLRVTRCSVGFRVRGFRIYDIGIQSLRGSRVQSFDALAQRQARLNGSALRGVLAQPGGLQRRVVSIQVDLSESDLRHFNLTAWAGTGLVRLGGEGSIEDIILRIP